MDEPLMVENRTFDEIQPGESASFERTITRRDIELYAAVSGDANPTHLDEDFARAANMQGCRRPRHAHGRADLQPARQPAARCRNGLCLRRICASPRRCMPNDRVTVTVTAREKRAEGRTGHLRLQLHQPGRRERADRHSPPSSRPPQKLRRPAVELAELHLQDHDHYEDADRAQQGDPGDHLRGGASVRGERAARVRSTRRTRASSCRSWSGPRPRSSPLPPRPGIDISGYELVDAPHSHAAAAKAVELVRTGRAELLMKGSLHTDELMGEVVAKETGLRTARRISHVFIMSVPTYPCPLFITDAAVNIVPDLTTKIDIVQNAIDLHRGPGPRRAARGDPVGGRDRQPRRCRPRWMPRPCARWPTAARSRAACSTAPWRSTTRSARRPRKDQGDRFAGGRPGADPGGARSRGRQHAGQEPLVPRQRRRRRHRAGCARADHPDQPGRRCPHEDRLLRGGGALCPQPARAGRGPAE